MFLFFVGPYLGMDQLRLTYNFCLRSVYQLRSLSFCYVCFVDCHGDQENRQKCFRVIRFNDKEQFKKKSNRVVTARYGILSFFPLFIIEQLIKFSNQYFLFISILQVSI